MISLVEVSLHDQSGGHHDDLKIKINGQSTVHELKLRIAQTWRVPPMCQKLTTRKGQQVLHGGQKLEKYRCQDQCIVAAVEAVVQAAREDGKMEDEVWMSRLASALSPLTKTSPALEDLLTNYFCWDSEEKQFWNPPQLAKLRALLSERCLEGLDLTLEVSVDGAIAFLSDKDVSLRIEAVESIAKFAQEGDPHVVKALCDRLEKHKRKTGKDKEEIDSDADSDSDVRSSAVEALAKVANIGHYNAISTLAACLEDPTVDVRRTTIQTLTSMVEEHLRKKAEKHAERAAVVAVKHAIAEKQRGVMEEMWTSELSAHLLPLTKISAKLLNTISGFALCQDEDGQDVNPCPWDGTKFQAPPDLNDLLAALVHNTQGMKRQKTASEMARDDGNENKESENKITHCVSEVSLLLNPNKANNTAGVRCSALECLTKIAPKDNKDTISKVAECLEDSEESVRQTATQAIAELATRGNTHAVETVSLRLQHHDAAVREKAVEALGVVMQCNDHESIATLVSCLKASHEKVRNAATVALAKVVELVVERAYVAIGGYVQNWDREVRDASVKDLIDAAAAFEQVLKDSDKEPWCSSDQTMAERTTAAVDAKLQDQTGKEPVQGVWDSDMQKLAVDLVSAMSQEANATQVKYSIRLARQKPGESLKRPGKKATQLPPADPVRQIGAETLAEVINQGKERTVNIVTALISTHSNGYEGPLVPLDPNARQVVLGAILKQAWLEQEQEKKDADNPERDEKKKPAPPKLKSIRLYDILQRMDPGLCKDVMNCLQLSVVPSNPVHFNEKTDNVATELLAEWEVIAKEAQNSCMQIVDAVIEILQDQGHAIAIDQELREKLERERYQTKGKIVEYLGEDEEKVAVDGQPKKVKVEWPQEKQVKEDEVHAIAIGTVKAELEKLGYQTKGKVVEYWK